jgi:Transcription factor zinc-finger
MADEKDRYGEKLKDVEAAREDLWARRQDEALLKNIRSKASPLHCPQCNKPLAEHAPSGGKVMACPDGHGAWIDSAALASLTSRK